VANESLLEPAPLVEQKQSRRYADWLRQNKDLMDTDEYATIARAYQMARRKEESLTGIEAIQEGIANLPASTLKLGKDVVTGAADALSFPFREPRKFAETAFSVAQTALPAVSGQPSESPLTAPAAGILGHYRGYLDPDVLKRRFADDPASTLSDLSLVGYAGGRLLKAVPTAPTEYIGGRIADVSEKADPLTLLTGAATYPLKKAGEVSLPGIPTADELKAQSRAAYQRATDAGVFFDAKQFDSFVDSLRTNLRDKEGKPVAVIPELHPKSSAVLTAFEKYKGSNKTLDDMDMLRQVARDAASSIDPADRRVGMILRNKIDEFVENVPAGDKAGVEALKEARDYWSRARKSDVIEDMLFDARLDSAGTFTGAGVENAIRREFKKLAKSNDFRLFNKDEQRAILDVVEGGPVSNAMRLIGKFAPTGVVSGTAGPALGSLLGFGAAGPIGLAGAAVIPAVGAAGRVAATRATESAAARAAAKMRAGKGPANVREKLAQLLDQFGDRLAATDKNMAFAVDMARRAKGNVNPYLTRQLIAQLENMERISQQRQALEQEE
jgi:hypothetical protein